MNDRTCNRYAKTLALALVVVAVAAAPSFAQTSLVALQAQATMPDATVVDMWGFFLDTGQLCTDVPVWDVGPTIATTTAAGTLTVNLRNCLDVDISIFIPGLPKPVTPVVGTDGDGRERLVSFDAVATPGGGMAMYTWNLKPGTYLYHSGTDVRTQVPMGLYGALVVDSGVNEAYTGVSYDQDEVLVFSEIDPALNANPTGYGGARVTTWYPRYFLINGEAFPDTADLAVTAGQDVLLRFVNAGLETLAPTLHGGLYLDLKAEDGNLYPHPLVQYGLELPAAKTIDAMVNIASAGSYALYDRSLHLTNQATGGGGMLTYIQAGAAAGAPTAVDDDYTVAEDGTLVVGDPLDGVLQDGVLVNDAAGTGGVWNALLVSDVSAGTLTLNSDGSFTYTPDPDFNGTDIFTYVANDGGPDSNVGTVTINVTPVNDVPLANPDTYDAPEGQTITVSAPGVLGNDGDVDGDTLTAVLVSGTATLNPDGSFTYTPAGPAGTTEFFTYVANDGTVSSAAATVTVNVVTPTNDPPTAVDDTATTQRNTPVDIYVIGNDTDPQGDNTIVPTSIVIIDPPSRGGTAVVSTVPGFVSYTPRRNFRGTDTFTYTIMDDQGVVSNKATVRVNVVR